MTRERARELLPVIQAWSEGKTIQFQQKVVCKEWSDTDNPGFEDNWNYRIKPEPKLRPWKPEEVPVGCLVRTIGDTVPRALLTSVGRLGVVDGAGSEITFKAMLSQGEHSLDHGKTWLPCGVQTEE